VVQENWPLELVPKIGLGMTYVDWNKIGFVYHTGKNRVKASEARDKELGNG
jgi:hypothetical protein